MSDRVRSAQPSTPTSPRESQLSIPVIEETSTANSANTQQTPKTDTKKTLPSPLGHVLTPSSLDVSPRGTPTGTLHRSQSIDSAHTNRKLEHSDSFPVGSSIMFVPLSEEPEENLHGSDTNKPNARRTSLLNRLTNIMKKPGDKEGVSKALSVKVRDLSDSAMLKQLDVVQWSYSKVCIQLHY
jgi:hypothetical protein